VCGAVGFEIRLLRILTISFSNIFLSGCLTGEHALTDTTNRRQANVISVEAVSCLTLSRADFRLLSNLKGKLLEAQATRGANNISGLKASADLIQTSSLANKRRISALNTHGHRDEMRINNLFKRFSKFATECLWNSLYSRLYRELLLDPSKQLEHGTIAEAVMRENEQRYPTVQVRRGVLLCFAQHVLPALNFHF